MVMDILLLTTVVVASVSGAPLHDGSETQTHSPIIAPDSESIIIAGTHGETHHSDVYLAKTKHSNHTELSDIAPAPSAIDATEIHHGDTYMMKGKKKTGEAQTAESTTHTVQKTTTEAVPHTTEKARGKNENSGAHPVAPVHHVNQHRKGGDGITKSIVAHSPLVSYVENSKSDKSEKQHPSSVNESGSVVAHGPMVKTGDNHEKKHGHVNEDCTAHSTVHHPPMATEHHPPKTIAHHPSLSKNVPISSGHAPMLNHPVVEEKAETEEPQKENVDMTTLNSEVAGIHSVVHAPTATDHNTPKQPNLAQHPLLSKTDSALAGGAHAPLAIPHDGKSGTGIHVEKRSEMVIPSIENAAKDSTTPPRTIEIHHPLLSKTEAVMPIGSLKSNHEDVRQVDHQTGDDASASVISTTEITGNSLETQHINSGHHLALSHPVTISPSA